jgi:tetraacyldisaccharide 4'-kinase
MREPYFWSVTEKRSRASAPMTKLLLSPLAMAYRIAGERRIRSTTPEDVGLPVVCIGNLTLGGAGKTPVTEAVRTHYAGRGLRAASLSRASSSIVCIFVGSQPFVRHPTCREPVKISM